MRVTRPELAAIIRHGRRTALQPATTNQPEGRHRIHRRAGPIVCYIQIVDTELVGPLDETITADDARQAGHPTYEAYRDDWIRTHNTVWTGAQAWQVTFTVAPWPETMRPMRGAWDPGSPADGVGPERRRAPEPESIDVDVLGVAWARDARGRHADALSPAGRARGVRGGVL